MGRYRYVILFIVLFFSAHKVNAAACDNTEKVAYQERAKNISYSYSYVDSDNAFNITFTNVTNGLYLVNYMEETDEIHDYYPINDEITINNVNPGYSYRFNVFTSDENPCSNSSIYSIYITLPYYNPYYHDTFCNGIKNYKYCKKFINKSITYEEFKTNVEKYIKSLEVEEEKEIEESFSIFDYIFNVYTMIILAIIAIAGILIIRRYDKKNEFF